MARLLELRVPSLQRICTPGELAADSNESLPPGPGGGDIAFLQYTSGSTGNPKGVVLSHADLLANIRAMGEAVAASSNDVFVSWLPLYHDMGLIGAWLGSLHYGIPLVIMSPLDFISRPMRWLQAIRLKVKFARLTPQHLFNDVRAPKWPRTALPELSKK